MITSALTDKENFNNNIVLYDYYTRLRGLALSCYEWSGLPDTVSEKFLEQTLFLYGRCLFINHPELGFIVTRCAIASQLNHYNEPLSYTAYATNYTNIWDAEKVCLIRNNYDITPTEYPVLLFARRLAQAEQVMNINVNAQKTPLLLLCDEKQRQALKIIYKQYDGNLPAIFGDKNLSFDSIKAVSTGAPYVTDKLMIYKHDVWNEAMTFLGIQNANTDKRERLITDEVESNDQMVEMSATIMLMTRQAAAKEINKMFGLNVSVKMRNIIRDQQEEKEEDMTDDQI